MPLLVLVAALAACVDPPSGGVVWADLGPPGARPDAGSRDGAVQPADDGGSGDVDGGIDPTGDGGTGTSDGGTGTSDGGTGTSSDGGTGGSDDGGTGGGSDGGGVTGGTDAEGNILCGSAVCDAATQQCCIPGFGGTGGACIARTSACMGASALCDGPEDCVTNEFYSEACCARLSTSGTATASCRRHSCGGTTEWELCHQPSDCRREGALCCPFTLFDATTGVCAVGECP